MAGDTDWKPTQSLQVRVLLPALPRVSTRLKAAQKGWEGDLRLNRTPLVPTVRTTPDRQPIVKDYPYLPGVVGALAVVLPMFWGDFSAG